MTAISELAAPIGTMTGLERVPGLKGNSNAGIPLFALGDVPRGTVLAIARPFLADTAATTDADPGAGNVRWNHATQTSATVIYIDDVDTAAVDISAALATLTAGGFLYLQQTDPAGAGVWQKWSVGTVTDAAGYTKIGVSLVASQGSFADNTTLLLSVQQPNPTAVADRNVLSTLAGSGSVAVDCAAGDYFTLALSGNVSGFTFSNLPASGKAVSLMIRITQDSTARTVAWPASFKWASGVASAVSTGSGAVDVLAITTFNQGTSWLATLAKGFA